MNLDNVFAWLSAAQLVAIGVAWGTLRSRLNAIEKLVTPNGHYLSATEAKSQFGAHQRELDTVNARIGNLEQMLISKGLSPQEK